MCIRDRGILCKGLDAFSGDYIYVQKQLEHRDCVYLDTFVRGSYDTPLSSLISLNARQLSVWGGGMQLLQEDLNAILSPKMRIVVLGGTERSARAAAEDLQDVYKRQLVAHWYLPPIILSAGRLSRLSFSQRS